MNDLTRLRLVANAGVISTVELTATGCDAHEVRALVRSMELVRVRAGAFVDAEQFRSSDPAGRHALAARAIARRLPGYAVSHVSALTLWDLPVTAGHLERVHVTRSVRAEPGRRAGSSSTSRSTPPTWWATSASTSFARPWRSCSAHGRP